MQKKSKDAKQFGADLQHVVASKLNLDADAKAAMVPQVNQPGGHVTGGLQAF